METPRVIAVLDGEVDPEDMLDLDYDDLYQRIQEPRSAYELLSFVERVRKVHVDLVGDEAFDALLERRLEGDLRQRLFNFCKTQHAMDILTETFHGYPLFESVIIASSFVRWGRFWASRGVGTFVYQLPTLD